MAEAAAVPVQSTPEQEQFAALERAWRTLKGDVRRREEEWAFWQGVITNPLFKAMAERWKRGIVMGKDELVEAEKAEDIRRLQASIKAKDALLGEFDADVLRLPLRTALDDMKRFEEEHALFVQKFVMRT